MPKSQIETESESHVYKYDKPVEIAKEQFNIFWDSNELGLEHDEADLRMNMTEAEVSAICYLQSILSKYEDMLGDDVWAGIIPKLFPRREIVRACSVISMVENHSHGPFYKQFNEILNVANDEFYSRWRYDGGLYKHIKYVESCSNSGDALLASAATCFLEGLNLFSAFGFFKSFNTRGWNLIPHFVSGIDGSAKDENFHSMFSSWLFRQCLSERIEASTITPEEEVELEVSVREMAKHLYEHEMAIIARLWDFENETDSDIRTVSRADLEHFVRDRTNLTLQYLGYSPMFEGEVKGEISKLFYLNVSSFKNSDFFAASQLQYTRGWNKSKLTFVGTVND